MNFNLYVYVSSNHAASIAGAVSRIKTAAIPIKRNKLLIKLKNFFLLSLGFLIRMLVNDPPAEFDISGLNLWDTNYKLTRFCGTCGDGNWDFWSNED